MTRVAGKNWKGGGYSPRKSAARELKRQLLLLLSTVILVGAVLGAAGIGLYKWLSHSDFFQITSISIQGTRKLAKATVLELSGIDIHSNLLAVDQDEIEARLAACGWIKKAEVRRQWPDRLQITIYERQAEALVYGEQGWYFVDREGVVFAEVEPDDGLDFPVITGLREEDWRDAGPDSAFSEVRSLLRQAGRGNINLPKQNISQLHVTNNKEIMLFLASRPIPIYLGRGEMDRKFVRLAKVLGWLYKKNQFSEATAIRFDRLDKKVLVERAGSG